MTERPFVVLDELSGTPLFTDLKIDGKRTGPGPPFPPPPLQPRQLMSSGLPNHLPRCKLGILAPSPSQSCNT